MGVLGGVVDSVEFAVAGSCVEDSDAAEGEAVTATLDDGVRDCAREVAEAGMTTVEN